jgi:PHP family Zn ribbon phosphoesterase
MKYRAEFHIHTVLSPCAEVEMIPPLIVETALSRGINLIAITDHNSSLNVESVIKAARGTGLVVFPGMEVQTREEVHTICLFDRMEQVESLQKVIDKKIPKLQNQPEHFGSQLIVDETGGFIRFEDQLLLTSVDLTLSELFAIVAMNDGLFIPAHVDRPGFGLIKNLGFVPTDIDIEVMELSSNITLADVPSRFPQIEGIPLIQSGDAHRLNEILGLNQLEIKNPTIKEIKSSIHQNSFLIE